MEISREIARTSPYILAGSITGGPTYRYYTRELVQRHTQPQRTIRGKLPAAHLAMEYADVIQFDSALLVGSRSIFQVSERTMDLGEGTLAFTAMEVNSALFY